MRTLNLKIRDEYFDKIVSFLELLPKESIIIEKDAKQEKLDSIKKSILCAKKDIKNGNTKVIRKIS